MARYQVSYPVDVVGMHPGSSDDLEEAGEIYLATPGATDIWDNVEQRFINPEMEIDCVARAYLKWSRRQHRRRMVGWLIPKRLKRRLGW